mmetsp:Transcript_11725/g.14571  ORF Transcript_11725/g.14571 Transcript_11725/m.14571 type:complete len:222 (-) Transcript_11725:1254-1919(-)
MGRRLLHLLRRSRPHCHVRRSLLEKARKCGHGWWRSGRFIGHFFITLILTNIIVHQHPKVQACHFLRHFLHFFSDFFSSTPSRFQRRGECLTSFFRGEIVIIRDITEELNRFESCVLHMLQIGVETVALPALHSEEMPPSILLLHLTIVTSDGHHLRHIFRNGLHRNTHRHGVPRTRHLLPRLRRLLTHRTTRVKTRQFLETMPMHGVTARQLVAGRSRRK